MGGILCLLFGSIAVVGLNTLIRHQVDLSEARNLVIVSVTLVFGIGGMVIGGKAFALSGIPLCRHQRPGAEPAVAGRPVPGASTRRSIPRSDCPRPRSRGLFHGGRSPVWRFRPHHGSHR